MLLIIFLILTALHRGLSLIDIWILNKTNFTMEKARHPVNSYVLEFQIKRVNLQLYMLIQNMNIAHFSETFNNFVDSLKLYRSVSFISSCAQINDPLFRGEGYEFYSHQCHLRRASMYLINWFMSCLSLWSSFAQKQRTGSQSATSSSLLDSTVAASASIETPSKSPDLVPCDFLCSPDAIDQLVSLMVSMIPLLLSGSIVFDNE